MSEITYDKSPKVTSEVTPEITSEIIPEKSKEIPDNTSKQFSIPTFTCQKCGHKWRLRKEEPPAICPKCKNVRPDRPYVYKHRRSKREAIWRAIRGK